MRLLLAPVVLVALMRGDTHACTYAVPVPHELDPARASDVVPPSRPSVTYQVSRREIGGGCDGETSSCDGKRATIRLTVTATDDTSTRKLGFLIDVLPGGDPALGLHLPTIDGDCAALASCPRRAAVRAPAPPIAR